jgi:hypothetical protein
MRYEVALQEKNVKKEDLSKTLQTKIDAIGKLVEKVNSARSPEQAAAAKDDLDELDIEVARSIKKFNPEVHQRRLASIANINDKRAVEPKIEKKPKPQPIEKEVEIEQQEQEREQEDVEVEQSPVRSARVERLEELQRKAREAQYLKYRQQELEQQRAQELDAEDEIKDFQKAKSVKPKGTSLSITLMGIGVFFLTWGTVNYFRTRKG